MTRYEEIQKELLSKQYTWLVTGAAGFIGSNLVEKLITLNQRVVGLDNFETGYKWNLEQALFDANRLSGQDRSDLFYFIEGDIRNAEDCQKAMEWKHKKIKHEVNFVLHQAALGSVPRSIEDPIRTNQTNINGFLNMLVAARDAKVKSFVYAASSSTYGDQPDLPKVEEKIGNPLSPYAVTKYVNELYSMVFERTYGFQTIGLRYFNVFGKRQDPNGAYAAVIPKWVASILSNNDVYINGDGKTSRDFCFIDNAVQMNILSAMTENKLAKNQVYNCALNERTTLNGLHKMISDRLLGRVKELKIRQPIYREYRSGDIRHSLADICKARNLLGYQPTHKIEEGLDKAIDWYVNIRNSQ